MRGEKCRVKGIAITTHVVRTGFGPVTFSLKGSDRQAACFRAECAGNSMVVPSATAQSDAHARAIRMTAVSDLQAIAQIILAAFLVLLAATGVAAAFVGRVRAFLLRRVLGVAYTSIVMDAELAKSRRAVVLEAVGVLEEGLMLGSGDQLGHLKVTQAVSALELHGPQDLAEVLHEIVARFGQAIHGMPLDEQRDLMRRVTSSVRRWEAEQNR